MSNDQAVDAGSVMPLAADQRLLGVAGRDDVERAGRLVEHSHYRLTSEFRIPVICRRARYYSRPTKD